MLAFNSCIIETTKDLAVAYKLNTAFYEAEGSYGFAAMAKTVNEIRAKAPEALVIADAKRGDIGHTAKKYASAFFEHLNVDAITLSPYMGKDSVSPFLDYANKWVILLAATSNAGFSDFQNTVLSSGCYLWEKILRTCKEWATADRIMFVVGATRGSSVFEKVRAIVPDYFLLVPGSRYTRRIYTRNYLSYKRRSTCKHLSRYTLCR